MPTTDLAKTIAELVQSRLRAEIVAQGHKLTGNLIRSVSYEIQRTGGDITIVFEMEDYGNILDKGVPASRIPYGTYTGAKVSKYIQGLKRYARLRFRVSDKEALRIAFAIANKHKYGGNGMPTRASYRFSKTGKRTDFVGDTIRDVSKEIEKYLGRIEFEILAA
jgi:hypothetical protein